MSILKGENVARGVAQNRGGSIVKRVGVAPRFFWSVEPAHVRAEMSPQVTCNLYMGVYNNNASDIEFVRDLHRKNCVELWLKKSQHEKFEWYLRMKKFTGGNWDTAVDGLLMRDDGDGDVVPARTLSFGGRLGAKAAP